VGTWDPVPRVDRPLTMGAVWVEASRRRSVGADGGAERRLCELQELWVPTGKWAHGVRERGRRAGFAFECPVRAYIEFRRPTDACG
jgi:hypothetical protein